MPTRRTFPQLSSGQAARSVKRQIQILPLGSIGGNGSFSSVLFAFSTCTVQCPLVHRLLPHAPNSQNGLPSSPTSLEPQKHGIVEIATFLTTSILALPKEDFCTEETVFLLLNLNFSFLTTLWRLQNVTDTSSSRPTLGRLPMPMARVLRLPNSPMASTLPLSNLEYTL